MTYAALPWQWLTHEDAFHCLLSVALSWFRECQESCLYTSSAVRWKGGWKGLLVHLRESLGRFGFTSSRADPRCLAWTIDDRGEIFQNMSYSMLMTSWSWKHLKQRLLRPCPGPCAGTYGVKTLTELLRLQASHCEEFSTVADAYPAELLLAALRVTETLGICSRDREILSNTIGGSE